MSEPFEGAISDRKIVDASDFKDYIEEEDEVLGKVIFLFVTRTFPGLIFEVVCM